MSVVTIVLTTLVALEHLYILYLETFATDSDSTSRVFNMSKEELSRPSISKLFKNQGIYNGLIAIFLLYGLFVSQSVEIVALFLIFVIAAASYGALTADKKIILTQGGLAILALISLLF
jgi:putative membrane protein